MTPHEIVTSFVKKEKSATDTYTFYFVRPEDFEFEAGQYIRLILDFPGDDPRGRFRFFTLSSSPTQKEYLTITTKVTQSPSLFKQALSSLQTGQPMRFFGPLGTFTLPSTSENPFVFLAGGIGMTPFHSMLLTQAASEQPYPITCIASFKHADDIVFAEELIPLSINHPQLNMIYTVTQQDPSQSWSGETGRISADMIRKYVVDYQQATYYLCGPLAMVDAMMEVVQQMGIPAAHIIKEKFIGY